MRPILAFGESPWHILLLFLVLLLLFGGKKLPEVARGLGEAIKEFKKAQRDTHDDTPAAKGEPTPPAQPAQPAKPSQDTNSPKQA
jgi:sec-independent protein translocase protein TatA